MDLLLLHLPYNSYSYFKAQLKCPLLWDTIPSSFGCELRHPLPSVLSSYSRLLHNDLLRHRFPPKQCCQVLEAPSVALNLLQGCTDTHR